MTTPTQLQPFFEELPPPSDLAAYVRRFIWGQTDKPVKGYIPAPPTGYFFLTYISGDLPVVHYTDYTSDVKCRLVIAGQLNKQTATMEIDGVFRQLGVEFTATGFYRLFHKPAHQFSDRIVCLRDWVPDDYTNVVDTLERTAGRDKTINHIIRYLKTKIQQALPEDEAVQASVQYIHENKGMVRNKALTDLVHLTQRQLYRRFMRSVGMPPKTFCKAIQLNSVIDQLNNQHAVKLHDIAYACGYYDQADFINNFQRYIGINPTAFLQSNQKYLRTYLGTKVKQAN